MNSQNIIIGIDAINIRAGGGITHLQNILEYAEPEKYNITQVILWSNRNTLDQLPQKSWLDCREILKFNQTLFNRLLWQNTELGKLASKSCDLLFTPGGLYLSSFRPYVTMFQNMQIFDTYERSRERGKEWLRLNLLFLAQRKTFQKASGLICLSEYAKNYLIQYHSQIVTQIPVQLIAHGTKCVQDHNVLHNYTSSNKENPLRLLYVSTVKKYKHQWNLIDAVGLLRKEGIAIELHLIGGGDPKASELMRSAIKRNDSQQKYIFYHGNLSYEETLEWYHKVNMFVFPSTCETFGISLLEAMTAGLPIASSDRGPMPEVLKDAGLYFNPESIISIKDCLLKMINDQKLCRKISVKAKRYSQDYSWTKCADETFEFLSSIYEKS